MFIYAVAKRNICIQFPLNHIYNKILDLRRKRIDNSVYLLFLLDLIIEEFLVIILHVIKYFIQRFVVFTFRHFFFSVKVVFLIKSLGFSRHFIYSGMNISHFTLEEFNKEDLTSLLRFLIIISNIIYPLS